MQCNIDRRGRRARLLMGIGLIIAAIALGTTAFVVPLPLWTLLAAALLVLGGGFAVFEAVVGWCAVRALGFRTRL